MSAGSRPNLGGLFNGSTPPDGVGGAAVFGPRFLKQLPLDEPAGDVLPEPGPSSGASTSDAAPSATDGGAPAEPGDRWNVLGWVDPTRLVVQYFAFLQAVLDTNRELAITLTTAVMSLPKRRR
jgi:hypothetical protein